jgi:O-antigen ligase
MKPIKYEYILLLAWLLFLPVVVTGNILYEPRLAILTDYLSLNTVMFFCSLILLFLDYNRLQKLAYPFFYLLMLIVMLICHKYLYSETADVTKLVNYSFLSFTGGAILCMAINTKAEIKIHKVTILFMLALFFLAMLWKLRYGFWDRSIVYFMNGPIVFGKHMGVALILLISLSGVFKSSFRFVLYMCFCFGVVWSMSKGPILATLFTLVWIFYEQSKWNLKNIAKYVACFLAFCAISIPLFEYILNSELPIKRVLTGLVALVGGDYSSGSVAYGSVGSRLDFYEHSLMLFLSDPLFGIGVGEWGATYSDDINYPHNFFMEILAETGIVGVLFIAIPACLFLINYKDKYFLTPLLLLVAQQFSGDLADARWIGIYSIYLVCRYQYRTNNRVFIQN